MFNVKDRTILFTIGGSRSYGIATPDSDVDVKGICIPPIKKYKLGIQNKFEQADSREHLVPFMDLFTPEEVKAIQKDSKEKQSPYIAPEGAIYDISKFFELALNANPNILEILFTDESDIRLITPAGEKLREHRDLFLSKKVVYSYDGYAFSQFKKIKSHRSWLLNPPTAVPTREVFGLPPERSLLSADEQNAFLWVVAEILRDKIGGFRLSKTTKEELLDQADIFASIQGSVPDSVWPMLQQITGAPTAFIQTMQSERAYRSAMNHWKSYLNWKANRNPKRAALEELVGFDSKHGAHLYRLMLQGMEIIRHKTLTVRLLPEDRKLVMSVRRGDIKYEELEVWFAEQQRLFKEEVKTSTLPEKPDRNKADELLTNILMESLNKDSEED